MLVEHLPQPESLLVHVHQVLEEPLVQIPIPVNLGLRGQVVRVVWVVERLGEADDRSLVALLTRPREPSTRPSSNTRRVVDVRSDKGGIEVIDGFEVGGNVLFGERFGDSEGGHVRVVSFHGNGSGLSAPGTDEGGVVGDHFKDNVGQVYTLTDDFGYLTQLKTRHIQPKLETNPSTRTQTSDAYRLSGRILDLNLTPDPKLFVDQRFLPSQLTVFDRFGGGRVRRQHAFHSSLPPQFKLGVGKDGKLLSR